MKRQEMCGQPCIAKRKEMTGAGFLQVWTSPISLKRMLQMRMAIFTTKVEMGPEAAICLAEATIPVPNRNA